MPPSRIKRWDIHLQRKIWVLMDPDKYNPELPQLCEKNGVSLILAGGSIRKKRNSLRQMVADIRRKTKIPVVVFPASSEDVVSADGILFTSLLSGQNVKYIKNEQAQSALKIKKLNLNLLPVAYLLVGSSPSDVARRSGTSPIPYKNKNKILSLSVMAEFFGFKAVYLEAGSGAVDPVPCSLIKNLKKNISIPVIVGGGITDIKKIKKYFQKGADVVVVGNALEKNPDFIFNFNEVFK
jgi:putative glycerol-1-phosphate prenyltransferase